MPLLGVPIALKDLCYTRGILTTAGSKILADFVPDQDSEVAVRLARAGAILLGKTNMHEFAYGITSDLWDKVFRTRIPAPTRDRLLHRPPQPAVLRS